MEASKTGRAYLKLAEAKAGQKVELDDGFTCCKAGIVELHADGSLLYFKCTQGRHYIHGQADDAIHCVGIYAT